MGIFPDSLQYSMLPPCRFHVLAKGWRYGIADFQFFSGFETPPKPCNSFVWARSKVADVAPNAFGILQSQPLP
jgi:hypothetical protein